MPYVFNPFTGQLDFTNPGSSFDPHSPGPIGDVTASTGAFTSITSTPGNDATGLMVTGGSITGSGTTAFASITGTWNTTGAAKAAVINITDTASGSLSSILELQRAGTSVFRVGRTGYTEVSTGAGLSGDVFKITAGMFNRVAMLVNENAEITFPDATVTFANFTTCVSEFRLGSSNDLRLSRSASGILLLSESSGSANFSRLQFGGTTSSFPSIKRSGIIAQARLADDSDFCPLQGQLRTHANAVAEIVVPTHTLVIQDASGTSYKVSAVPA